MAVILIYVGKIRNVHDVISEDFKRCTIPQMVSLAADWLHHLPLHLEEKRAEYELRQPGISQNYRGPVQPGEESVPTIPIASGKFHNTIHMHRATSRLVPI